MAEPTSSSAPSGRLSARIERLGLGWLYALVAVPVLTDIVETGGWPQTVREWFTEAVAGLVIAALVRQVRREHLSALALSRSDALTGLGNRRALADALEDECARARRSGQPLALVYIDLDHFKRVNDREGHERGDQVLQQLAAAIRDVFRARIDRGFRVGGDEFVVLLPGSSAAAAEAVVARIRAHCARQHGAWVVGPLAISSGIVAFDGQEPADAFLRRADAAMYRQKASGRS
jgi:diguanylate cyclase (GGDEF)-like protein